MLLVTEMRNFVGNIIEVIMVVVIIVVINVSLGKVNGDALFLQVIQYLLNMLLDQKQTPDLGTYL